MGLKPGVSMRDLAVNTVFIGSCTNSRIEDLREAAGLVKGRKVATGVRALVVPGSEQVKRQAEIEGLDAVFVGAGFEWHTAGCSMCLGMNGDILRPTERSASTSNRPYEGRQGPGSRTHLVSPITAAANAGNVGINGEIPNVRELRIPVQYLANLLTAGDTGPVLRALERMLAMRAYQRTKHVDGRIDTAALDQVGISAAMVEDMYQVMAIANYEDRFVIPTTHREYAENAFDVRGGCGFSFGNGCSDGASEASLFGGKKRRTIPIKAEV
jgi:hypothetical protein